MLRPGVGSGASCRSRRHPLACVGPLSPLPDGALAVGTSFPRVCACGATRGRGRGLASLSPHPPQGALSALLGDSGACSSAGAAVTSPAARGPKQQTFTAPRPGGWGSEIEVWAGPSESLSWACRLGVSLLEVLPLCVFVS